MEGSCPSQHRVDRPRIELAVRKILVAIGEGPEREGLRGKPGRSAEAYEFLFAGLGEDSARHLRRTDVGYWDSKRRTRRVALPQ